MNLKAVNFKAEKMVDILLSPNSNVQTLTDTEKSKDMDTQKHTCGTKLKNIQTALDIIDSNNSAQLMELFIGLRNDVLKTVKSKSFNIKDIRKSQLSGQCINSEDMNAKSCMNVASLHQKTKRSNPITKVKLTRHQLMRERYIQKCSKDYLKYPYKCKNCIQGFNYKENLEDHMSRKHDAVLGQICEICTQYHSVGTLDVHMRRHFYRYVCVCLRKFLNRDDAIHHYTKAHVVGFKCNICGYMVESFTKMQIHRIRQHKFVCEQCSAVFTTSRRFKRHIIIKHK